LRVKISGMSDITYIHEEIKEQIKYGECQLWNTQMETRCYFVKGAVFDV